MKFSVEMTTRVSSALVEIEAADRNEAVRLAEAAYPAFYAEAVESRVPLPEGGTCDAAHFIHARCGGCGVPIWTGEPSTCDEHGTYCAKCSPSNEDAAATAQETER